MFGGAIVQVWGQGGATRPLTSLTAKRVEGASRARKYRRWYVPSGRQRRSSYTSLGTKPATTEVTAAARQGRIRVGSTYLAAPTFCWSCLTSGARVGQPAPSPPYPTLRYTQAPVCTKTRPHYYTYRHQCKLGNTGRGDSTLTLKVTSNVMATSNGS